MRRLPVSRKLFERAWYRRHPAQDREVFASLYNDRAISYRVHKGFAHEHVRLECGHSAHGALGYWVPPV
jgi:hypothetical protein